MTKQSSGVRRFILFGLSWTLAGRITQMTMTLAIGSILASSLSALEFAEYYLLVSVVSWTSTVARFGLGPSAIKMVGDAIAAEDDNRAHLWATSTAHLALALGLGSAGLLASPAGSIVAEDLLNLENWQAARPYIVLWVLLRVLNDTAMDIFRSFGEIRRSVVYANGPWAILVAIALAILAGTSEDVRLDAVVAIMAGALLTVSLVALPALKTHLTWSSAGEQRRRDRSALLSYGWPLMISELVGVLYVTGNLWVLAGLNQTQSVAEYGIAIQLSTVAALPLLVSSAVLAPVIARRVNQEQPGGELETIVRSVTTGLAAITCVGLTVLYFTAGWIVKTIYGADFSAAVPALLVLSTAQVGNVLGGPAAVVLQLTKNQWTVVGTGVGFGSLSIAGALFLAPQQGALGAAIAAALGITGANICLLAIAWNRTGLLTSAYAKPSQIRAALRSIRRSSTQGVDS